MDSIPSFAGARVLVVGDVMLDRYWYGDTGRISPEAPVPVVKVGDEERRLGGAANVALNVARVGAAATLIGVVGDDEQGRMIRRLLREAGVTADLLTSPGHPTIAKLRVVSRNQQLIRLDFERSFAMDNAFDHAALIERVRAALPAADVVVCSDYAKGTLAGVADIIALAREAGVPVLVDPKGVDWQHYSGATLIKPNASEFSAYADKISVSAEMASLRPLADQALDVRRELNLDALLITRSEHGMNLFAEEGDLHLPTHAREVFDVTGAGDTVAALLAAGLATGLTLANAAKVANLAAGLVVGKLGTATVTHEELRYAAWAGRGAHGIVDEDTLAGWFKMARSRGERIVMTNGCFDLLHPGHITYLEAARALGDWLVVAVNDDASVTRLKGQGRPINDLHHRMQVLRGLAAVDWVVPFSEDTPERLICRLCPDILVKGGDYRVEDIAGGACVVAAGGEVRTLDFVSGFSSSAIVERMQASPDDSGSA